MSICRQWVFMSLKSCALVGYRHLKSYKYNRTGNCDVQ